MMLSEFNNLLHREEQQKFTSENQIFILDMRAKLLNNREKCKTSG